MDHWAYNMFIIEKKTEIVNQVVGFKCDKCAKTFTSDNFVEMQECIPINIMGGWGSVFGDGSDLSATFCQNCAKELFGAYMNDNTPQEAEFEGFNLSYEQALQIRAWEESGCTWRRIADKAALAWPDMPIDPGNQLDGRELAIASDKILEA